MTPGTEHPRMPSLAPGVTGVVAREPMWSALRADHARYLAIARADSSGLRAHLQAACAFGFLASCVYRYGRWTRRVQPRLLALPLVLLYHLANLPVRTLLGIELSTLSVIGPGLYIGHSGGIVVCGQLGAGCSLGQGVTIGSRGAGRSNGYPVLGNGVYLGAGAMVLGRVKLGDGVVVGANTVVVTDVPAGCRVVAASARILPPRPTHEQAPPRDPGPVS